jgi:hypothetical protein
VHDAREPYSIKGEDDASERAQAKIVLRQSILCHTADGQALTSPKHA